MASNFDSERERSFVRDCWATNHGIRLHYLDCGGDKSRRLIPLVFVPGALGSAELYVREMQSLAPRKCIAISLRGRGQSEAPERGYAFEDHVSDIQTVIQDSGLAKYCLFAYSMGVPYAIEQTVRDQGRVTGLIIGDYAARAPEVKPEWVEQALRFQGAKRNAVYGLQRESKEVVLWDKLELIKTPVLVIRGGKPGSLLSSENAELYRKHLKDVIIVQFEDSDHSIFEPNYERYLGTIRDFLQRLDKRASSSMVV